MLNLFRQDYILIKKSIRSHLIWIFIVIPIVIGGFGGEENIRALLLSVGYIMIFFTINYDKDDVDNHIIIGYLPINNKDIVLEKYILLFINYILGIMYSFLILYILSLFGFDQIRYVEIGVVSRISLILFLGNCIVLPLYFYLTNKWFKGWSMFVLIMLANTGEVITGEYSIFKNTSSTVFFVITIIIYILSLISSIYIYKNRDIG